MPLPYLVSASLLICERALFEKDEIVSAIRLVDIFIVPSAPAPELSRIAITDSLPANASVINAYVVASVRATPGYTGSHNFSVKILNTLNELSDIFPPTAQSFSSKVADAPTSAGFIAALRLVVRNLGNCYVCLYLDGEEVARHPLTIALAQPPENHT
jgi:hypothetical protein